jgi:hypothetical protein
MNYCAYCQGKTIDSEKLESMVVFCSPSCYEKMLSEVVSSARGEKDYD